MWGLAHSRCQEHMSFLSRVSSKCVLDAAQMEGMWGERPISILWALKTQLSHVTRHFIAFQKYSLGIKY